MTRRTALVAAVCALIAAAIATGSTLALTRDSDSPRASSRSRAAARPHSRPETPGYLYVSDARSSTLEPAKGKGRYVLTMRDVHPNGLYYVDRPGDEVGSVPLQVILDNFFGKSESPRPNAAINAVVPGGGNLQSTMGVKLLSAHYDPKSHVARYTVQQLEQGPVERTEHGRTDVVLPRTLNRTALFIDDGDYGRICGGSMENATNDVTINTPSYSNWGSDSWESAPSGSDGYFTWESDGGFDRGCHAYVNFPLTLPDGTTANAIVSITDPWSGSNSESCTMSGLPSGSTFKCIEDSQSTNGGNAMDTRWLVCSTDINQAEDWDCDRL